MSGASRLRSTRVGALSPTQLIFPSPPNAPSSPLPKPSPPAPRRHDGEAWRSGGRQRRLCRDLKSEREMDAAVEYQDEVAAARDESRAYADSIRSATELRERQLYREREEARQLAEAMQQSVAYSGGLDEGQQAAFLTLCNEVGVAPADPGGRRPMADVTADAGTEGERQGEGTTICEEMQGTTHISRREEGALGEEVRVDPRRADDGGGRHGGAFRD